MRKVRYRQVLRYRCKFNGKRTFKGIYLQQVDLQKMFWREDNEPTPSIVQVRKIHSEIGTWDKHVRWERWEIEEGFLENFIVLPSGKSIYPKSSLYKKLLKYTKLRWIEQERRTEEFFESMGV